MKWNLSSKLQSSLTRVVTNIENEAYYNEPHETSEPMFWLAFGIAITIALVSLYVTIPLRRWYAHRSQTPQP